MALLWATKLIQITKSSVAVPPSHRFGFAQGAVTTRLLQLAAVRCDATAPMPDNGTIAMVRATF
jgi:hypothetical protein